MTILGLLGIVVPDMVINLELGRINIISERTMIILKYLMFCIVFTFLDKYFDIVNVIIVILSIVDVIFDIYIVNKIRTANISFECFIEKLRKFDTSVIDSMKKYYLVYCIGLILYIYIHSNIYEMIVGGGLNVVINYIVIKNIVAPLNPNIKTRAKLLLWVVFCVTIISASFGINMVTFSLIGIYVMISTDLLQPKKTSVIKYSINSN
jgi:hypothetical protein